MQSTHLYDQDNYNIYNDSIENDTDNLAYETPVGWSSICLDQTIHYYIDCNMTMVEEKSVNT